ncbi:MAG: nicotinate (nicotinamide) nucleotide adenylyltransferase [Candidatus Eisenbacteria bacterium]|uniref:Probable nicotinate-nucleotide adenylyltransferase n=1 Tax=Eiseniibacteriota bacterium TaxID=2212470 RepID=A0A7Y2EC57_UNCEI|nr:nicotinate (nicotinamide) nucleotide adenylyltransferase [Candidatus Eisenbacteria bacterium]
MSQEKPIQKLGIFGGSFNPIHRGHLYLADLAKESMSLDQVLFVPAADPPHKDRRHLALAHHRLAMLELAIQSERDLAVSTIELEDNQLSYTIDTLRALGKRYPNAELHFIMGMDSLRDLPTWKDPEMILGEFSVIAIDRPGIDESRINPVMVQACHIIRGNPFAISATLIRRRILEKKSIRHLVPNAVGEYISQHNLYQPQS